jgi:glycosyltransferase involved in cell wall biosynthesis
VLQVLPALAAGGAERSTLEVAAALVAAGHRSIVLSAGGVLVDRLRAEGSEHISLPIGAKSLRSLLQLFAIRRLLRSLQPDLIHVRSRLPAWLIRFALIGVPRDHRPALVSTVHGLNSVSRYSAILTRAERVICVSQTAADYLREHYPRLPPERIRVIPRGVDPRSFAVDPDGITAWKSAFLDEYPELAGTCLLTLPGRGSRLKGHEYALRLLAELRRRGLDARLLLLGARQTGRNQYLAELESLADGLGLRGYWLALPQRADVAQVIASSDLILQLSNRPESFGRTVAEALHLGRPVLGWDLGGVGEQLRAAFPAGRVAPFDSTALADRAAELLRQPGTHPIDRSHIATVAELQRQTLAVYAEVLPAQGTKAGHAA